MPELPEVETVTNALRPHLLSRKIIRAETYTGRLREKLDIHARVEILDQEIVTVRRRAKYIVIELENLSVILLHLGMTGSCRIEEIKVPKKNHDQVSLYLDDRKVWRFNDPRKFGIVKVEGIEKKGSLPKKLQNLPPEPLSTGFSQSYLIEVIKNRKKAIKSVLMDSQLVTGIGNIYANESLFMAGIHPNLSGFKLSRKRVANLIESIRQVLNQAIQAGGTTISDFVGVDGAEGKFSLQLQVYGRQGEICNRCSKENIVREVTGGRSTFFCPKCQK